MIPTARIARAPSLPYSHLVRGSEANSTSFFFKDQPRLRHIPHRDRHQFPPARSNLVQPGLHILGVGKHLNDFILEPFRLLSLRCKWLPDEKQEPQRTKTDTCYHPRPRKTTFCMPHLPVFSPMDTPLASSRHTESPMHCSPYCFTWGAWNEPDCPCRTSTFLSCAFREKRDLPSYPAGYGCATRQLCP